MRSKLELLEDAIGRTPAEFQRPKLIMSTLLDRMDLGTLRAYSCGLLDMAMQLTSDDHILEPLIEIGDILK